MPIALFCSISIGWPWNRTVANILVVGPPPSASFSKIQDVIDASFSGDTVLVKAGTYLENLDFRGNSIVLRSESGLDQTTIDGSSQDDSVIRIMSGEDSRTMVEGFTITGGRGYYSPKSGGGVLLFESSCTLRSNFFVANQARGPIAPTETGWGGGVYCGQNTGHVVIENNVFRNNSVGSDGGGVAISGKMSGTVSNNQFIDNDCIFGDGGGLWVLTKIGNIDIHDNIFTGNFAGDHGGGAYIASVLFGISFDFVLQRNIFADNTATSRSITADAGGGCWIASMNGPITSNTFVRNLSVSGSPADGSGLAIIQESAVAIEFNLFALNRPGAAIFCTSSVVPTMRHNLFWGNLPANVIGGACADQVLTDNLFADPQFCDSLSTENFSLAESSPALTYPAGPIGAVTKAGCPGTEVEWVTWSYLKTSGVLERSRRHLIKPHLVPSRIPIIIAR